MMRYHPVIAFKRNDKIIEHISKCVEGKSEYFNIKSDFSVLDDGERRANNCECLVNRCVLGLNFSELVDRRNGKSFRSLNIQEELNNNRQLNNLTSYPSDKIRKIKEYIQNSGYENFNVMRDGINMYEARIEVQPKSTIFKDINREYF